MWDGIEHALYARTDAFEGPDKNQGSSEFEYFDANLVFVSSPSRRIFTTYGARTEAANLPAGTADYLGRMESYNHDRNSPDNALRIRVRGDLALNADFDASTLEGQIDRIRVRAADEDEYRTLPDTTRFAIENGRIIDGQFAAALTGMDSNPTASLDDTVRGYEGDVLGEFYGPSAEEVGGVLNAESEAHDRVVNGWFGGTQFALNPRIPAGNLSILSALLDWDENTETMRPSDTQVTAVESDGAAGLRMSYSVGGTEHTVHLSASDYDEGNEWYFKSDRGRAYYLWNMDGSLTVDDEEFSYFNVNGWYEGNDDWPPSDLTRGYIVYGNPTETLPVAGTAEYAGRIYAEARPADGGFGARTRVRSESLALTADFGQSTLGGTIDDIEIRGPEDDSSYEDANGQFTIQNGSITNGRIAADLSGSQDPGRLRRRHERAVLRARRGRGRRRADGDEYRGRHRGAGLVRSRKGVGLAVCPGSGTPRGPRSRSRSSSRRERARTRFPNRSVPRLRFPTCRSAGSSSELADWSTRGRSSSWRTLPARRSASSGSSCSAG